MPGSGYDSSRDSTADVNPEPVTEHLEKRLAPAIDLHHKLANIGRGMSGTCDRHYHNAVLKMKPRRSQARAISQSWHLAQTDALRAGPYVGDLQLRDGGPEPLDHRRNWRRRRSSAGRDRSSFTFFLIVNPLTKHPAGTARPGLGLRSLVRDIPAQEVSHQRGDFVAFRLQSEVAGIKQVILQRLEVALVRLGARGREDLVVFAPGD
jgi:hypothetical protein